MVPVVVRVDDERRRGPTELAEGLNDRRSVRGVDYRCLGVGEDVMGMVRCWCAMVRCWGVSIGDDLMLVCNDEMLVWKYWR